MHSDNKTFSSYCSDIPPLPLCLSDVQVHVAVHVTAGWMATMWELAEVHHDFSDMVEPHEHKKEERLSSHSLAS